jgi:hypothetical protein
MSEQLEQIAMNLDSVARIIDTAGYPQTANDIFEASEKIMELVAELQAKVSAYLERAN